MEKITVESEDMRSLNVEKIGALFPNCITETRGEDGKLKKAINFETLQQMLSEDVIEGDESYEFTWVGKKASIAEANRPIQKTLRPCPEESVNWDTTENLYIEGDNLQVLKLLQKSYLGKIKMIYIDPPYNTGEDFIYNDDFSWTVDEWDTKSGRLDDEGNRLFKNTESNGRFHSDWCSMMYSRLLVAQTLLRDDGVIFISIDDDEVDNLRKICDEVFGEDNFVNAISLKLKNIAGASGGGEDKRLKKNMEFILLYAKNYHALNQFQNVYSYTPISKVVEQYREEGRSWKYTSALLNPGDKTYVGSTLDGDGLEIKIYRRDNFLIKSVAQIMKDEGISEKEVYDKYACCIFQTEMPQSSIRPRVLAKVTEIGLESELYSIEYVPKTGRNKGVLYEQYYKGENFRLFAWLKDVTEEKDGILYKKDLQGTFWDFVGETKNLTKEGSVSFPNGKKPSKLIQQMLEMVTEDSDFVLDFFSGSATTAHAVMQQNSEDSRNRKFIMVQIAEDLDISLKLATDKDAKASIQKSIDFLDEINKPHLITELGKERIRRAGKKINPLGIPDLDIGFRVLKLDDWNKKDVEKTPAETNQSDLLDFTDNLRDDRTDLDLLFGCLIDSGLELTKPITSEDIDGCTVYSYNEGWLVGCFAENVSDSVIQQIAAKKPRKAVFRDSSFADSPAKINVTEIFKMISPDTQLRVI